MTYNYIIGIIRLVIMLTGVTPWVLKVTHAKGTLRFAQSFCKIQPSLASLSIWTIVPRLLLHVSQS